jgi:hypothetical protein
MGGPDWRPGCGYAIIRMSAGRLRAYVGDEHRHTYEQRTRTAQEFLGRVAGVVAGSVAVVLRTRGAGVAGGGAVGRARLVSRRRPGAVSRRYLSCKCLRVRARRE